MTTAEIITTIKARRKALGLSQQEVADRVGILRPSYERIENGRSSPTLQSLLAISDALGMQISIAEK